MEGRRAWPRRGVVYCWPSGGGGAELAIAKSILVEGQGWSQSVWWLTFGEWLVVVASCPPTNADRRRQLSLVKRKLSTARATVKDVVYDAVAGAGTTASYIGSLYSYKKQT